MEKSEKKYWIKKVAEFVLARAVEFTVFYFLYRFVASNFERDSVYWIMGGFAVLYVFYIASEYVDDYRKRHRYDDVIV